MLQSAAFIVTTSVALAATAAQGVTISFSGLGAGDIDGQPFQESPFDILLAYDAATIQPAPADVLVAPVVSASISIAGVATGQLSAPTRVFVNHGTDSVGFGRDFNGLDQLFVDADGGVFNGYDLAGAFGPVFDPTPGDINNFTNFPTSFGAFSFEYIRNVTFRSPGVPEPSSFALAALAVLALWTVPRPLALSARALD